MTEVIGMNGIVMDEPVGISEAVQDIGEQTILFACQFACGSGELMKYLPCRLVKVWSVLVKARKCNRG